jgi:hypothetical protein
VDQATPLGLGLSGDKASALNCTEKAGDSSRQGKFDGFPQSTGQEVAVAISDLDPAEWRGSEYTILAHDFGLTNDFSTGMVIGKWTDLGRPVFGVYKVIQLETVKFRVS